LADQAEISDASLKTWVLEAHGVPIEQLDRRQASSVITELNTRLSGGNGRTEGGAS